MLKAALRRQWQNLRAELVYSLPVFKVNRVLAPRFRHSPPPNGKTVLFASYDPGISAKKHWMGHLELLIAKHLQLAHGLNPVFFLKSRHFLRWNLFRGFGMREVLFSPDFAGKADPDTLRQIDSLDFDQIAQLWVKEVPLGRLVIASARRIQQKSRLETSADRVVVRQKFAEALDSLAMSEHVLEHVRPDAVVTNHVTYIEQGGVLFHLALARGLPTYCVRARNDKTFVFRRFTPQDSLEHPNGISIDEWQALLADAQRADFVREAETFLKARMSGEHKMLPQAPQIGLKHQNMSADSIHFPEDKPVIGVFTHLPWDASGSFYHDLFPSLRTWVEVTTHAALENTGANWIFRIHPSEAHRGSLEDTEAIIRALLPAHHPHIHIIPSAMKISSYSLIPRLAAAVTVRSTLSQELPCLGLPVICAGSGPTSVAGFNLFPRSAEDYCDVLSRIHTLPRLTAAQVEEAHLMAYAFFIYKVLEIGCVSDFITLAAMRHAAPGNIVSDAALRRAAGQITAAL